MQQFRTLRRYVLAAVLAMLTMAPALRADDWPQWLGPKRDGVWRETGIIERFPQSGPKYRWRTAIGEGYAGPAVVGEYVYITDRIRAAGAQNPANPFGKGGRIEGSERVLCLEEKTGKIVWTHEYKCTYQVSYAAGPRTTPVVDNGKVYTLGTMGDLFCLDAATGKVLWSKNFVKDYAADVPQWGFAAHPLLDGNRLICLVGGKGSVAVAFDKDTGNELWRALSAGEPGYAPPMLFEIDGKRQLIIWHPESVNALVPETGEVIWSQPFTGKQNQLKAGLSIPTPRLNGNRLFLTAFYDGPLMLQVDARSAKVLWRGAGRSEKPEGTDGLHSIMSTPVFTDDHIYGVCSYGEMRCLDAKTGKRLWSTHAATGGQSMRWANAFLVPQGDRYVLFNELGDLIIARMTPDGYDEISKVNILTPTNTMAPPAGRRVIWMHPAFANRCVYARNDREIVCVSMAAEDYK